MLTDATIIQHTIVLNSDPAPDWDSFVPWGQQLLQQIFTIAETPESVNQNSANNSTQNNAKNNAKNGAKSSDSGADRHMLRFTFSGQQFSLNLESYSDSIWIAAEEPAATSQMPALLMIITTIISNHRQD